MSVTPVPIQKHLRITVEIDGETIVEDLAAQVEVQPNPESLNKALIETPQRFAWWATLENIAERDKELLENQMTKLVADRKEAIQRVEGRLLAEFHQQGGKVDEIKGKVAIHPDRIRVVDEYAGQEAKLRDMLTFARFNHNQCRTGRKSMEEKKEGVIERCRNMRGEMQVSLRVPVDRDTLDEARERLKNYMPRR